MSHLMYLAIITSYLSGYHVKSNVSGYHITSNVSGCYVTSTVSRYRVTSNVSAYHVTSNISGYIITSDVSYRTKICRTKLWKFRLGVENFVRRKMLSVKNFVQYFSTKVR